MQYSFLVSRYGEDCQPLPELHSPPGCESSCMHPLVTQRQHWHQILLTPADYTSARMELIGCAELFDIHVKTSRPRSQNLCNVLACILELMAASGECRIRGRVKS